MINGPSDKNDWSPRAGRRGVEWQCSYLCRHQYLKICSTGPVPGCKQTTRLQRVQANDPFTPSHSSWKAQVWRLPNAGLSRDKPSVEDEADSQKPDLPLLSDSYKKIYTGHCVSPFTEWDPCILTDFCPNIRKGSRSPRFASRLSLPPRPPSSLCGRKPRRVEAVCSGVLLHSTCSSIRTYRGEVSRSMKSMIGSTVVHEASILSGSLYCLQKSHIGLPVLSVASRSHFKPESSVPIESIWHRSTQGMATSRDSPAP